MRKVMVVLGAVVALVVGAAPASAGPAGGSTTLLGPPVGGQQVEVAVVITGVYPVVAYEFTLENRCWFGGRFSGPVESVETYPLLGPWFDVSGGSSSVETVSLTEVPSGAVCKVSVSRGSSPVKGTTTPYAVG